MTVPSKLRVVIAFLAGNQGLQTSGYKIVTYESFAFAIKPDQKMDAIIINICSNHFFRVLLLLANQFEIKKKSKLTSMHQKSAASLYRSIC